MKNPPLLALLLIAVPMLAVGAGLTPVQPAPASKTAPKPGTAPKAVPPSAPQLPVPGLWGQNSPLPIRINSATLSPTSKTRSVTKELALNVVMANTGANPANPNTPAYVALAGRSSGAALDGAWPVLRPAITRLPARACSAARSGRARAKTSSTIARRAPLSARMWRYSASLSLVLSPIATASCC